MTFLDRWLRLVDRVATIAVWSGGALLLAAAALVGVEVVLRKALRISLGGADELSGYAFAIATSWALAFALLRRAHVRVDVVYARLPARLRAGLDLVALVAMASFAAVLTQRAAAVLGDSLAFAARATTPLATPLWIPQAMWLGGFALFLLALAPLVLRCALALVTGDTASVQRLAGARSLQEDAAAEIAHVAPPPGGAR